MLSDEEIKHFIEEGYVIVRDVFSKEAATAARDVLWDEILKREGVKREDPCTWTCARIGIAKSFHTRDGMPWSEVLTPKLHAAIKSLLYGAGFQGSEEVYEDFGTGWFTVSFPGYPEAKGKMHIDGHWFTHFPFSKQIGLVPLFMFSDVSSGGTNLARKSHVDITCWVADSGCKGMSSTEINEMVRDCHHWEMVEISGNAGDVCLMHPFLAHCRGRNLNKEGSERAVRFISHPTIGLKKHMNLNHEEVLMSPLEYSIARILHPTVREEIIPSRCEEYMANKRDAEAFEKRNREYQEEQLSEMQAVMGSSFNGFGGKDSRRKQNEFRGGNQGDYQNVYVNDSVNSYANGNDGSGNNDGWKDIQSGNDCSYRDKDKNEDKYKYKDKDDDKDKGDIVGSDTYKEEQEGGEGEHKEASSTSKRKRQKLAAR